MMVDTITSWEKDRGLAISHLSGDGDGDGNIGNPDAGSGQKSY